MRTLFLLMQGVGKNSRQTFCLNDAIYVYDGKSGPRVVTGGIGWAGVCCGETYAEREGCRHGCGVRRRVSAEKEVGGARVNVSSGGSKLWPKKVPHLLYIEDRKRACVSHRREVRSSLQSSIAQWVRSASKEGTSRKNKDG